MDLSTPDGNWKTVSFSQVISLACLSLSAKAASRLWMKFPTAPGILSSCPTNSIKASDRSFSRTSSRASLVLRAKSATRSAALMSRTYCTSSFGLSASRRPTKASPMILANTFRVSCGNTASIFFTSGRGISLSISFKFAMLSFSMTSAIFSLWALRSCAISSVSTRSPRSSVSLLRASSSSLSSKCFRATTSSAPKISPNVTAPRSRKTFASFSGAKCPSH
mmetsp:Transcript_120681/g.341918  ORF Transcript_120681/g.341918 Transcript_120681/m.341918 type:complete len:222 (-) Transcript_120681:258-923(-)